RAPGPLRHDALHRVTGLEDLAPGPEDRHLPAHRDELALAVLGAVQQLALLDGLADGAPRLAKAAGAVGGRRERVQRIGIRGAVALAPSLAPPPGALRPLPGVGAAARADGPIAVAQQALRPRPVVGARRGQEPQPLTDLALGVVEPAGIDVHRPLDAGEG